MGKGKETEGEERQQRKPEVQYNVISEMGVVGVYLGTSTYDCSLPLTSASALVTRKQISTPSSPLPEVGGRGGETRSGT